MYQGVKEYTFFKDCCQFDITDDVMMDALHECIDNMREVTWRTFIRNVPVSEIRCHKSFDHYRWVTAVSGDTGFHLKDDWAVRFARSTFMGRRCYVIEWSAIEHIWLDKEHPAWRW